jgi:hypothetical protein
MSYSTPSTLPANVHVAPFADSGSPVIRKSPTGPDCCVLALAQATSTAAAIDRIEGGQNRRKAL